MIICTYNIEEDFVGHLGCISEINEELWDVMKQQYGGCKHLSKIQIALPPRSKNKHLKLTHAPKRWWQDTRETREQWWTSFWCCGLWIDCSKYRMRDWIMDNEKIPAIRQRSNDFHVDSVGWQLSVPYLIMKLALCDHYFNLWHLPYCESLTATNLDL